MAFATSLIERPVTTGAAAQEGLDPGADPGDLVDPQRPHPETSGRLDVRGHVADEEAAVDASPRRTGQDLPKEPVARLAARALPLVVRADRDRVEVGTPLVTFDRAVIEKAGYPIITPVIVLNADDFDTVDPVKLGPVAHGDPLLDVQEKG